MFLGYASGVGKSFRMVDEGRRRKERGEDVIVGAIQPATSPEVEAVFQKLEIAPVHVRRYARHGRRRDPAPQAQVCLVDGLAYDNPPGSRNPSRWKDVVELLQAGIDVITSINIQYIAELRERVERLQVNTSSHCAPVLPLFGG